VRATVVTKEAIEELNRRAIEYIPELIFEFYNSKDEPGYQSPEYGWWIIPKGNFKISLTTGAVRQLNPDIALGGDPIELWRKAHPSYHFKQAFEAFTRWVEDRETGLEPDPVEPEEKIDEDLLAQNAVLEAVLSDGKPVIKKSALKIFQAVVAKWGKVECSQYHYLSSATNFKELLHIWATGWDLKFFTVKECPWDSKRLYTLTPVIPTDSVS
jgi:hypothetical protein